MKDVDCLIVGKGPAGIQAALYTVRSNVNTVIIGKDIGANAKAHKIDNYYGIGTISGHELVERGIKQAQDLGVDVITDEVLSIEYDGEGFIVNTTQQVYKAISVLLASGCERTIPRIRKIRNYEGKGLSYCAICDGFFFRNKNIAVIGAGDYAAHEAEVLLDVSEQVTVFTDGVEPTGTFDSRLAIIKDKVTEIIGNEKVEGIITENNQYPIDGIFVAVGSASSTDLAIKLGIMMENTKIIVDENQQTNIPGLYAAGDCTPGVQQIAKAVGDGCVAGMNISKYVRNHK